MKKFVFALVIVLVFVSAVPTSAMPALEPGGSVVENFNDPIQYRLPGQPSDYYWWAILDNDFLQYYGSPCDPEGVNCLTRELEGGDYFARLAKGNDPTPFGYNNVEFSELQTGYSYGQNLERWYPTPGHPVIFSETVRFGPNYGQDGTGGAVGSLGGGLWNSYPDFPNQTIHPITAIWWSWNEVGAAQGFLSGLSVNVLNNGNFVYLNNITGPQYPLDMQDWMTINIGWFALPGGFQKIVFTITQNGHTYNAGTVTTSGISPLSVTNWNDNSFFSGFDPNGNPIIEFHNPATVDYWDVTNITVLQP